MGDTGISYLQGVANPVEGCSPVSPGCMHCYATTRLARFRLPTKPTLHPDRLDEWIGRRGRIVGVGFQTDLFHPDIPVAFLAEIVCRFLRAPQHIYLMLTKRSERLAPVLAELRQRHGLNLAEMGHVWVGVTGETQGWADQRVRDLLAAPVAHRWLSAEPQLENILPYRMWFPRLEWVAQGCESGPRAQRRPFELDWARDMRAALENEHVPYYFKQAPYETGKEHTPILDVGPGSVVSLPRLDGKRYVQVPTDWSRFVTPGWTPLESWKQVKEQRRQRSIRRGGAG